jgi:uncharacterized protein YgbK (DUF1537 family)
LQIGIIADDLTSAADAGAPFARTGHSVAVGFGPAALQANVDALALDLDSRRGSICRAVTLVEQAAAFLGPSPILYLTMDSTLRGHIGAQVAAALRASGRRARRGEFDVVVAQYHDQGLIPVKYLGVDRGVNIIVGLPFVRTSVDHGTAFDIAGTGKADQSSLRYALLKALAMTSCSPS